MNMIQKFRRRVQFATALTSFQRMSADDVTPDGYRSKVFQIVDLDHIRWADVGTGSAADAKTFDGDDIIDPVPFFHFKGTGSRQFPCKHGCTNDNGYTHPTGALDQCRKPLRAR